MLTTPVYADSLCRDWAAIAKDAAHARDVQLPLVDLLKLIEPDQLHDAVEHLVISVYTSQLTQEQAYRMAYQTCLEAF